MLKTLLQNLPSGGLQLEGTKIVF